MSIRPIHIDFAKQREAHVISQRAKPLNFVGATRFLRAKLIAWKPQDAESARAVALLQGLKTGVLPRENAFTRGVYNQ